MRCKRILAALLVCAAVLGCTIIPVGAMEVPDAETVIPRVSGSINSTISANSIVSVGDWFYLSEGDIIKFDCTYTPASASMDFGAITPDGLFHPLNTTSGSFKKSFVADETGQYLIVIRNNEDYAVTVTGSVRY